MPGKSTINKARKDKPVSQTRSRARVKALKKEPVSSASSTTLSRQARSAARKRTPAARSAAAKKASKTKKQ